MHVRTLREFATGAAVKIRTFLARGNTHSLMTLWAFFLIVLFFGSNVLSAVESGSATEAVKQTIDEVLVILADQELKKPERKEELLNRLLTVIGKRFDYEEMGKRTLAKHWKEMNEDQQQEFVGLFRQFLTNSYASNVSGYSGEEVEYVKERLKGDFAEVQTKVVSPKLEVPLNYRLLNKNGDWWVYDVLIDGVSLMKNYRGQFNRIIQSSSYDGLLEKLRSKANKGQSPQ